MPDIAVLPGDGIGPEIVREAVKVMTVAGARYNISFNFRKAPVGGAAYDAAGNPLPEETLALCRKCRIILFGAIGGPKWSELPDHLTPERGGLLRLRRELALYANLRPAIVYPELIAVSPLRPEITGSGADIMFVRELTGGLYFGKPKRRERTAGGWKAIDTMVYESEEIERIMMLAFETARQRRGKVTSVDKANVLENSKLWRETAEAVGKRYPDVELEHMYVDNCAMQLIIRPQQFDVIVTENTFGDILSDEASVLAGSIGLLPSASLGRDGCALYEPIHGSAPDIAGQGRANPIGAVLSAAMLFNYSLKQPAASRAIASAIAAVLAKGYRTADIMEKGKTLVSTAQMGDLVAAAVERGEKSEKLH